MQLNSVCLCTFTCCNQYCTVYSHVSIHASHIASLKNDREHGRLVMSQKYPAHLKTERAKFAFVWHPCPVSGCRVGCLLHREIHATGDHSPVVKLRPLLHRPLYHCFLKFGPPVTLSCQSWRASASFTATAEYREVLELKVNTFLCSHNSALYSGRKITPSFVDRYRGGGGGGGRPPMDTT
jgi:hypothetical protein